MSNKGKVLPNTFKHKIYEEFAAGVRPAELVNKYPLKYGTLMQYFFEWKHKTPKYIDPVAQLTHFIHDKKKPISTNNESKTTAVKPISNPIKPVEKKESTEDVVMIPKEENVRIPEEEWKPIKRSVRHNPFGDS